jgi:surfeit locus 1 family protein
MTTAQGASPATPRSTRARRVVALCLALACAGFFALGIWQLQRLQWKNALIAQVDQRVHAAPVAAPSPSAWTSLSKDNDEYRHLRLEGRFLDRLSTKVQAVSELGAGFWVLTPFVSGSGSDGPVVLVNRGFIPNGATPADAGPGPASITGLLRMSERGGGFLRDNDPQHDRWFSRDVEAIGAARGLHGVAPWFLDQDAAPASPAVAPQPGSTLTSGAGATVAPVGGLTVISFHNSHLVYALTWFAMGLMAAGAGYAIARGKI